MALSRAHVETILVKRLSGLMPEAGLAVTFAGSNADLNDPIGWAIRQAGGTVKVQGWNGSAWSNVGSFSSSDQVNRLAQSPAGMLYAYVLTVSDQRLYRLSGTTWSLISVVDGQINSLWVDQAGLLYAAGEIVSVAGVTTASGYVTYNGST